MRQLIGWIAAYALALQAVVVAVGLPHRVNPGGADAAASSFTLCITDADGSTPIDHAPGGAADCDFHCTLARSVGVMAALALGAASADVEFSAVSIAWTVTDDPLPNRPRSVRKPSRGPPHVA